MAALGGYHGQLAANLGVFVVLYTACSVYILVEQRARLFKEATGFTVATHCSLRAAGCVARRQISLQVRRDASTVRLLLIALELPTPLHCPRVQPLIEKAA